MAPIKRRPTARTKVPPIHKLRVQDSFDRLIRDQSTLLSPASESFAKDQNEGKKKLGDSPGPSFLRVAEEPSKFRVSTSKKNKPRTKPKKSNYGLFSSLLAYSPAKPPKKKRPKKVASKAYNEYMAIVNRLARSITSKPRPVLPLYCSTPVAGTSSRNLSGKHLHSDDAQDDCSNLCADVSFIPRHKPENDKTVDCSASFRSCLGSDPWLKDETSEKDLVRDQSESEVCQVPASECSKKKFPGNEVGASVRELICGKSVADLCLTSISNDSAQLSELVDPSCDVVPENRSHLSANGDGSVADEKKERDGSPDLRVNSSSANHQSPSQSSEKDDVGLESLVLGANLLSLSETPVRSKLEGSLFSFVTSRRRQPLPPDSVLVESLSSVHSESSAVQCISSETSSSVSRRLQLVEDECRSSACLESFNEDARGEISSNLNNEAKSGVEEEITQSVPKVERRESLTVNDALDKEGDNEEAADEVNQTGSWVSSDSSFGQDHVSFSHLDRDSLCNIIGVNPNSAFGVRFSNISATSSRSNSLTRQNVSIEEEASSSARESGASSPVDENDSEEISIDFSESGLPACGSSSNSRLSRGSLSPPVSNSSGDSEKSASSPDASHSEDEASFTQQSRYRSEITTVRYSNALYDIPENQEHSSRSGSSSPRRTRLSTRRSSRAKEEKAPGKLLSSRPSAVGVPDLNVLVEEDPTSEAVPGSSTESERVRAISSLSLSSEHLVLLPGKKYRKSLAIIRMLTDEEGCHDRNETTLLANGNRGRHFEQSVDEVLRLQSVVQPEESCRGLSSVSDARRRLSVCRMSLMSQCTPPPRRRVKQSIYSTPTGVLSFSLLPRPSPSPSSTFSPPRDETVLADSSQEASVKDIVFGACKQTEPRTFSDILDETSFEDVNKVGEGAYGEVFLVNRGTRKNVLKIIPIEGNVIINGERQKRYDEIYTELLITQQLHSLAKSEQDYCTGFAELVSPSIVRDRYPQHLIDMWLEFDNTRGSDNENPRKLGDNQLYLVLELGNGGTALEDYSFSTARQTLSIFKQVVMSLAVAERRLEFEHRDLHWGNILVSRIHERHVRYVLDGREHMVPTSCVKATIIDYTLSRMTFNRTTSIFNDIGKDPEMFVATGDYQFDIYRYMKKDVGNEWSRFVPKTNVRWLHYVIDKMINTVKYQRRTAKIHGDSMKELNLINNWILTCDSSYDVAMRLFY